MWLLRTILLEVMWFSVILFVFINDRSIEKEFFITLSRARHFQALSRDSARLFGVQNCESTTPEKEAKLLIFQQLHPAYSLLSLYLSLDGLYVFCFSLTIAWLVKVRDDRFMQFSMALTRNTLKTRADSMAEQERLMLRSIDAKTSLSHGIIGWGGFSR